MIIEVKRESKINNAILSRVFIDGSFFCYGLENDLYKIPTGVYSVYGQTSPKFGTNKIYLNVPNRSGIMFHGGNNADQTKGCIIASYSRNGEFVSNDASGDLFDVVDAAYKNGETINVKVTETNVNALLFAAGALAFMFFLVAGKRAK